MADLIRRIRERKIVQWLIVYVTGAWAVSEVIDTLVSVILSAPSIRPILLLIGVLGIPFVLVLAWYHGEKGRQRVSGPEAAILVALFAVLGGIFMLVGDREGIVAENLEAIAPEPAIAILPPVSAGAEAEEIGEGIVNVLSTGLDAVPGWRAVNARTVFARWSERVPGGTVPDEATALAVARATGASFAVLPSTTVLGNTVRVTANVYDLTHDGQPPRSIERSGSSDDPLSLADALAVEILGAVLQGAGQIPEIDLSRTTSESPEALEAFLRGEVFYREFRLADARDAFLEALELDSTFARAHYRLIEVHTWGVTWNSSLVALHQRQALAHIDRLSEREALVVRGLTAPDRSDRIRLLRQAVARYPDDATAWSWLGEELIHGLGTFATAAEIDSIFRRAIDLDPRRAGMYPHAVGLAFAGMADSARAAVLVSAWVEAASGVSGTPVGDIDPRGAQVSFEFAFGNPSTREAARVRILDGYSRGTAEGLAAASILIGHPRHWQDIILPTFEIDRSRRPTTPGADDPPPDPRRIVAAIDGFVHWTGRIRDGVAWLDSIGPDQARSIHDAALMGMPIPATVLNAQFGQDRIRAGTGSRVLRATMLAAHEGRWSDFERGRSLLEADSMAYAPDLVQAADAYAALVRGNPETARELFEPLASMRNGEGRLILWLLGETYMALQRWADAERVFSTGALDAYYRQFSVLPLVRYRLGQALEAQGRAGEAIEAYSYFTTYWADADPELQPLVQDALKAIERLSPDRAPSGA